ncbi:hypothetical protein GYA37_02490 [candidate division WWE3 bacterium]|uniref:Uncharacterized protein n=1 Tax=candidate division WWE3 bacterium TaxID=2053526 RepID=A0A7X9E7F9_UNCKA|nr:hypothetical protein [candidate division WWE3 bacterium]
MDEKKEKKGRVVKFLILALAVVIALAGLSAHEVLSQGSCSVPEGSSLKNVEPGIYKIHEMDSYVYIVKGITIGEYSEIITNTSEKIPACYSKEDGVASFANLILEDEEGNIIILLRGYGGAKSSLASPLQ